jgi:hypothetical protein
MAEIPDRDLSLLLDMLLASRDALCWIWPCGESWWRRT